MKKSAKRAKSKSGVKSKAKKATKAKRSAKSKKTLIPKAGSKLKRVAKKAAVAAGLALSAPLLVNSNLNKKRRKAPPRTRPKPEDEEHHPRAKLGTSGYQSGTLGVRGRCSSGPLAWAFRPPKVREPRRQPPCLQAGFVGSATRTTYRQRVRSATQDFAQGFLSVIPDAVVRPFLLGPFEPCCCAEIPDLQGTTHRLAR